MFGDAIGKWTTCWVEIHLALQTSLLVTRVCALSSGGSLASARTFGDAAISFGAFCIGAGRFSAFRPRYLCLDGFHQTRFSVVFETRPVHMAVQSVDGLCDRTQLGLRASDNGSFLRGNRPHLRWVMECVHYQFVLDRTYDEDVASFGKDHATNTPFAGSFDRTLDGGEWPKSRRIARG